MTEVNVGDVVYRAYYFGDEIVVDASKIVSVSYAPLDLDEMNATCRIERTEDNSIHEAKVKRIIEEFSISRIRALTKLFDKHMKVLQKVLEKMDGE